jgi:predicted nucleic acid-binding protein
MAQTDLLIFDTGPLSHFARENWLGALKAVVGERTAVVPDVVVDELKRGLSSNSFVQAVLDASWIGRRDLQSVAEIERFAHYSSLLVAGDRNRGEAGVLALAATTGGTAVVDDLAGRKAAKRDGIPHTGTLGLLMQAIQSGLLTVALVSAIADDLLAGAYRLPFRPGGFAAWAEENGLTGSA